MIPAQLLLSYKYDNGVATATVTGTAQQGQTLTCTFNNNDPDGPAIGSPTFQWRRSNGTSIVGATNSTYLLTASEVGLQVFCRVNYVDNKGFSEQIDSNSTATVVAVTPGSQTFDSGSGNFVVPAYNTLTVEVWGAGAAGGSWAFVSTIAGSNVHGGSAAGASSVSTLGLTANGGGASQTGSIPSSTHGSSISVAAGAGGTASGGSSNTTGGTPSANGAVLISAVSVGTSSAGGAGAGGGAGGAGVTDLNGTELSNVTGNNGTAPGGAGSGGSNFWDTPGFPDTFSCRGASGGGGGKAERSYTLGVGGAPAVGASLAYAVGAGGTATAPTGTTTRHLGGNGANGRVRFTWA